MHTTLSYWDINMTAAMQAGAGIKLIQHANPICRACIYASLSVVLACFRFACHTHVKVVTYLVVCHAS